MHAVSEIQQLTDRKPRHIHTSSVFEAQIRCTWPWPEPSM